MNRRSDRPTLAPAYDVDQYARDSDRIAIERAEQARNDPDGKPSEVRLITRPQWGRGITNDAWARTMSGSPTVTMAAADLKRLPLDHRSGFLLSLMDGSIDLETLLEVSGMDRNHVISIIRNLFESGVVEFL